MAWAHRQQVEGWYHPGLAHNNASLYCAFISYESGNKSTCVVRKHSVHFVCLVYSVSVMVGPPVHFVCPVYSVSVMVRPSVHLIGLCTHYQWWSDLLYSFVYMHLSMARVTDRFCIISSNTQYQKLLPKHRCNAESNWTLFGRYISFGCQIVTIMLLSSHLGCQCLYISSHWLSWRTTLIWKCHKTSWSIQYRQVHTHVVDLPIGGLIHSS